MNKIEVNVLNSWEKCSELNWNKNKNGLKIEVKIQLICGEKNDCGCDSLKMKNISLIALDGF